MAARHAAVHRLGGDGDDGDAPEVEDAPPEQGKGGVRRPPGRASTGPRPLSPGLDSQSFCSAGLRALQRGPSGNGHRNQIGRIGIRIPEEEDQMDTPTTIPPPSGVKRRGFASLTPERRKEIAIRGGQSVPEEKRSFSQNRDLARAAGRKGGAQSSRVRKETSDV